MIYPLRPRPPTEARGLASTLVLLMAFALKNSSGMELVKPRLLIPTDSYEEFMIRGPVTFSYVVTVLNGTEVDAVVLDKANFIRFANKGDAEFVEEVWEVAAEALSAMSFLLIDATSKLPTSPRLSHLT